MVACFIGPPVIFLFLYCLFATINI